MTRPKVTPALVTEFVGAVLILIGLWRVYSLFQSDGYLGPPFVYDVGDTFMDWFNTAWWAHNGQAYDVWRTVYLPLSFIITGVLGNPRCYNRPPYDARDCDVVGIAFILLIFVGCTVVTAMALWRRDRSTAVFRTIAIGLGGPMLFALERGQLLMVTFILFAAIYGGLIQRRGTFVGTAALMANTKVYMVFPLFALGIKREWRLLEYCGLATVGVYLATLFIVGEGTPIQIADNLQNWFVSRLGTVWDEMLYTTTYKPLLQLDVFQIPVRDVVEQRIIDPAVMFITWYVPFCRLLCFACIGLSWLYPTSISHTRLAFFILMQSFINQNPGGYAIALLAFLVFQEKVRNPATMIAVGCAYLISIPGDLELAKLFDVTREAWLSGRLVESKYVVPWGALVRPGVIAIMLWALAYDSLVNIHRLMRERPPTWGMWRSDRLALPHHGPVVA